MNVEVYLTPLPFGKAQMENKSVVVIDVLRSSTSICAALAAGAKGIIPTDGPGGAGEMRMKIGTESTVLAGERQGVKIENFHLGNSPAEFTADSVGGKFVIMTTTNGTGVFERTHSAAPVLACGLVNISKAAEKLAGIDQDLIIVCSGREGGFSIEDTLCAGMLINRLNTKYGIDTELNDAASLALLLYQNNESNLLSAIAGGEHGRFLESIGFGDDVTTAVSVDSLPVLPVLRDGRLVPDADETA